MPISSAAMCKLFEKEGYKIVQGGKGSHTKLKRKNSPTIIIPYQKELKKGLEHDLLKQLKEIQNKR